MISFSQVRKSYRGGHEALAELSFQHRKPENWCSSPAPARAQAKATLPQADPGRIERRTSGTVLVERPETSQACAAPRFPICGRQPGYHLPRSESCSTTRERVRQRHAALAFTATAHKDAAGGAGSGALDKVGLLAREKANPNSRSPGRRAASAFLIARARGQPPDDPAPADEGRPRASDSAFRRRGHGEMFPRSKPGRGWTVLIAHPRRSLGASALNPRVLVLNARQAGIVNTWPASALADLS